VSFNNRADIRTEPPTPEEAVLLLMNATVPERANEIAQIWKDCRPQVQLIQASSGIKLEADKDVIVFDDKTMTLFWLIGFSGWKAIETYAPAVVGAVTDGLPVDAVLANDPNLEDVERDYKERLAAARSMIAADDPSSVPWPPDVPPPVADRKAFVDVQHLAVFDLTCMATAFTLFHELRHVLLYKTGARPEERPEEELDCDVWARDFMMAKLAAYADGHHHTYQEVLAKRSMALALSALIVAVITPEMAQGGSAEYFSVSTRLEAIILGTPLPDDHNFWVLAAAVLISLFRQRGVALPDTGLTAADLTQKLISRL